jgi:hypothetical protein
MRKFKVTHPRFARPVFVLAPHENDVLSFCFAYSDDVVFFIGTIEETCSGEIDVWLLQGGSVSTSASNLMRILFSKERKK